MPKPKHAASCPAGFTEAHCKMCAASKSPASCYECVQKAPRLGASGWDLCGVCGNLSTPEKRSMCTRCLAEGAASGPGCAACLTAAPYPQAPSAVADACFDCVVKAPGPARNSSTCANCFGYGVTAKGGKGTAACVACVTAPGLITPWGRTACDECSLTSTSDYGGCVKCLAGVDVKSDLGAQGCAACAYRTVRVVGFSFVWWFALFWVGACAFGTGASQCSTPVFSSAHIHTHTHTPNTPPPTTNNNNND